MYLRTPMCAAPLAPPPDNTNPTLGRFFVAVSFCENDVNAKNKRNKALMILVNFIMAKILFSNKFTNLFKNSI
jgi:hypothetical protein